MSESIMERIARNKVFIEQFAKMELPVVDGNLVHHRIEVVVPVRKSATMPTHPQRVPFADCVRIAI